MKFNPHPGILVATPIEEKTQTIQITDKSQSRLVKGKVIAIGKDLTTDLGAILKASDYAKIGDIVYFLSYEGNYDNFTEENKKYYVVKWQDLRTRV